MAGAAAPMLAIPTKNGCQAGEFRPGQQGSEWNRDGDDDDDHGGGDQYVLPGQSDDVVEVDARLLRRVEISAECPDQHARNQDQDDDRLHIQSHPFRTARGGVLGRTQIGGRPVPSQARRRAPLSWQSCSTLDVLGVWLFVVVVRMLLAHFGKMADQCVDGDETDVLATPSGDHGGRIALCEKSFQSILQGGLDGHGFADLVTDTSKSRRMGEVAGRDPAKRPSALIEKSGPTSTYALRVRFSNHRPNRFRGPVRHCLSLIWRTRVRVSCLSEASAPTNPATMSFAGLARIASGVSYCMMLD